MNANCMTAEIKIAHSKPQALHYAQSEGFFGMLKRERVNRRRYFTRAEARADIFDYIECFYNPRMRRRLQRMENQEIDLNSTVRSFGA
jgi:Integrase core domain